MLCFLKPRIKLLHQRNFEVLQGLQRSVLHSVLLLSATVLSPSFTCFLDGTPTASLQNMRVLFFPFHKWRKEIENLSTSFYWRWKVTWAVCVIIDLQQFAGRVGQPSSSEPHPRNGIWTYQCWLWPVLVEQCHAMCIPDLGTNLADLSAVRCKLVLSDLAKITQEDFGRAEIWWGHKPAVFCF